VILASMKVELSASYDLARRARVHAALGDPHRLRIVELLALSDLTPSEVAADLGIDQSTNGAPTAPNPMPFKIIDTNGGR